MIHDVICQVWNPAMGSSAMHTMQVDAAGGDDAVSKAKASAVAAFPSQGVRIVSVVPAGDQSIPAAIEGADDEADADGAPTRRGPGRPRKVDVEA